MLGKRPGHFHATAKQWAVQARVQTYQDVMDSEVQNGCKVCSHVQGLQGMLGGSQARATAKQWAVPSRVLTYQAVMGSKVQNETNVQGVPAKCRTRQMCKG